MAVVLLVLVVVLLVVMVMLLVLVLVTTPIARPRRCQTGLVRPVRPSAAGCHKVPCSAGNSSKQVNDGPCLNL